MKGSRIGLGPSIAAPNQTFKSWIHHAILPRKGPVTRTMSKRLQEDWARAAEEGPRVLMNLRTHILLEVASPLSLPSPFHCHSSSKKQRNPLMKKILGLQAPMELTSIHTQIISKNCKEHNK
ncbi:hypothetical protein HKD37_02G004741 [Glycine soja]